MYDFAEADGGQRRQLVTDLTIVHDHLVQRGGAERVVVVLSSAFKEAPVYTSVYEPSLTYAELASVDIHTLWLNRVPLFRHRHRLALPLLAPAFSHLKVDSRVTLCSSIGWVHGVRTTGRKLVYCWAPARWLYQSERYIGNGAWAAKAGLGALKPFLGRWDHHAAATADRYLVPSRAIQAQVASVYGIGAEVVAPPVSFRAAGPTTEVPGIAPGFLLCVSRLLPYKNVAAIIEAFALLPAERLVVAGVGPLLGQLGATAGPNVRLLGGVDEATLRWLYRSCAALVAASYEDFGLTPLEAAAHGKPSVVLRAGGFLDTVSEEETGIFFDDLSPANIASAVRAALGMPWDERVLVRRSELFSVECFVDKMRSIVAEELALAG